jgi:conjugal transfer ATP-binding protein TraC
MADQNPQKDQNNKVLNNTLFLEKHEEKGPEKALTPEEKALEGLEFEGEGAPEPSWLKNLNEESSAAQKFAENKGKIDQKEVAILQSTAKPDEKTLEKPVTKVVSEPVATVSASPSVEAKKTEEIPAQLVKKAEMSGQKPAEKSVEPAKKAIEEMTVAEKKKSEEKANVLQNVNKGLFGFFSKSKTELEKAKSAGVEEAGRTLENYNKSPVELALEKTPVGQAKKQSQEAERKALTEAEKIYQEGMATVRDLIAPSSMDIQYDHLRVEGMYARSFVVYSYPRYLDTNWLSPVINMDVTMDVAQFIYPIDSARIMKILSKKVTQMQSAMSMNAEKGLIRDPALETAYEDAENLRTEIQRGQEKFFQFAMYITIYSEDLKKIDQVTKQLESILGSKLILTKRSDLRMEHGFNSTMPICLDEMEILRNMNTGPLSTTFPFSSSDLTSNEGILYGLNRHNDSLIIFDRFSLPNANSVVFAISGAGKSYTVKLEILRYLMLGVDVIVIDPENEYEALTQTVGGSYLKLSLTSDRRINPFDLPSPLKDEELQPGDLLRSNIITLQGLLKIMLGGMTPTEEGIMDKALNDVYALKGITMEITDPSAMPVPTMEDLHSLLTGMQGAENLAQRLEKFTKGTYSGIFNKPTNLDMKSGLMVFSIRDLDDSLRPIAMYIILNYIWNRVRSELKKRIMVVDEAWTMMQHEDSAKFLFGLVKRARKYYLGITTITQDVEDFMKSSYGKPIVTNSAMQMLLKQSPASISILQKVFNLTEGEKYMLLNSGVGQGLFFAGQKHVAVQVIASYTEDKIVTTNPEEILRNIQTENTQQYE